MRIEQKIIALIVTALITVTGCKNDDDQEDQPTPSTARTITADFEPHWGTGSFALGTDYVDAFGNVFRMTRAQIYVGNMTPIGAANTAVGDFSSIFLIDFSEASNSFTLGTVSETHVHEIEAYIGVDSVRNHADPMLAGAPLNDATMHWGWNPTAGYKFAVFEGEVDTDGDGTVDSAFVYHLATDGLFSAFEMEPDVDINQGETFDMHVEVDLRKVLDAVDIANNLDTHTNNEPVLAAQLMSNLAGAFKSE